MHIREIDRRVGPLHDVIVGIDAGLAAIHERLNSEEGFDGTSAREHVEPLLGLAFVAAQSYALGSVSDLNAVATSRGRGKREKLACYACDPMPPVKGVVTRMQLINASATTSSTMTNGSGGPRGGIVGSTTQQYWEVLGSLR